jgi:hypothetical protein
MTMILRIVAIVTSIMALSALGASAAGSGEQGSDSYTITYVGTWADTMPLGDRTIRLSESAGISRNDAGHPMFDNMGVRCLGLYETVSGVLSAHGACSHTDKNGDQIYSTYEIKGPAGTHTFVGGTGKYSGITGTADFTRQVVRSPDGRALVIVHEKANWKLPGPS